MASSELVETLSIHRVFSALLDSRRYWYVLDSSICGTETRKVYESEFFRVFPDEIRRVQIQDLKREDGTPAPASWFVAGKKTRKLPCTHEVYVSSSFGIFATLLRRKSLKDQGFIRSTEFQAIIDHFNAVELEETICHGRPSNVSSKSSVVDRVDHLTRDLDAKSKELILLRTKVESFTRDSTNNSLPLTPPYSPVIVAPQGNKMATSISELMQSEVMGPIKKKRTLAKQLGTLLQNLKEVSESHDASLSTVIGNAVIYGGEEISREASEIVAQSVDIVAEKRGVREAISSLISEKSVGDYLQSMRQPDWTLLYFKLAEKFPDHSWQMMLNITHMARSGRLSDVPIFLTKNQIKAIRHLIFGIVSKIMNVKPVDASFPGYEVDLSSVLVWAIREQCLHQVHKATLEFNIKLDGRPLGGKDQVSVGIVPINVSHKSSESSLSVFPLAIANCKEKRDNLLQLIKHLNVQKKKIKTNGIIVDGKKYNIKFTATLDYKSLLLLLVSKMEEEGYTLGGKGLDVSFCAYCDAIRACKCHGVDLDETCVSCLRSKANINRSTPLRDDLDFLLEEDLSNINLCSLHCEMHNTEQLLGSLGLFAYRVGSLPELNDVLSGYGPENARGYDRITIKERAGQQTEIERKNISVRSFSGSTEREILRNVKCIVERALPLEKVTGYYEGSPNAAKDVVLNYATFCEEQCLFIKAILDKGTYTRNCGKAEDIVSLETTSVLKQHLETTLNHWEKEKDDVRIMFMHLSELQSLKAQVSEQQPKKKRKKNHSVPVQDNTDKTSSGAFGSYAGKLQIRMFSKVFCDWSEIALTLRNQVFGKDDDELIDIHEVKCKQWGFLLRKLFGLQLGTGDYGHLTIAHSGMLLRQFRSLHDYSNQGFEASHKLHRSLFSRATNHDAKAPGQSIDQILTHWYAEYLLRLRYAVREGVKGIRAGNKVFHFRGCGWTRQHSPRWTKEESEWVLLMEWLFNQMLGGDFLKYEYHEAKGSVVSDTCKPLLVYDHTKWEDKFHETMLAFHCSEGGAVPLSLITPQDTSVLSPPDKQSQTKIGPQLQVQKQKPAKHPTSSASLNAGSTAQKKKEISTKKKLAEDHVASYSASSVQLQPMQKPLLQKINPQPLKESPPRQSLKPQLPCVKVMTNSSEKAHCSRFKSIALNQCMTPGLTRAELASIQIPVVSHRVSAADVSCSSGNVSETDPFSLRERPCQAVVDEALRLFDSSEKSGTPLDMVHVKGCGDFTEQSVLILKKFCSLSSIKQDVLNEQRWLNTDDGLSTAEVADLQFVLWHKAPSDILLRHKYSKNIDTHSFSLLALERHIDNFMIDVCIEKFLEEAKKEGLCESAFLPLDVWSWIKAADQRFTMKQILQQVQEGQEIAQLLIPLHMANCHWGLIVVDFANKELLFDDGLRFHIPDEVMQSVKHILDLLCCLSLPISALGSRFWKEEKCFKRFGMPAQNSQNQTGSFLVSGSCGIGVILAARDFIFRGSSAIHNFAWNFAEMAKQRKKLMLKILEWS